MTEPDVDGEYFNVPDTDLEDSCSETSISDTEVEETPLDLEVLVALAAAPPVLAPGVHRAASALTENKLEMAIVQEQRDYIAEIILLYCPALGRGKAEDLGVCKAATYTLTGRGVWTVKYTQGQNILPEAEYILDPQNSHGWRHFSRSIRVMLGPAWDDLSQIIGGSVNKTGNGIIDSEDETEDAEAPFIHKLFGVLRIY